MTRSEIRTQPEPVAAAGLPEDRSSMTSIALPMSCAAEFPGADVSSATDGARTIAPGQSRTLSLLEAATNVVVGYVLAILTQLLIFPVFGLEAAFGEHLAIGLAFVGVSLARAYLLRRVFERFGT
jgi:hypothetical protein